MPSRSYRWGRLQYADWRIRHVDVFRPCRGERVEPELAIGPKNTEDPPGVRVDFQTFRPRSRRTSRLLPIEGDPTYAGGVRDGDLLTSRRSA